MHGLNVAMNCLLPHAGVLLASVPAGPETWLPAKLGLLLACVVLGSLALKRA